MSTEIDRELIDRLDRIVKAYDIRGLVPDEIDERTAWALGAAFGSLMAAEGASRVLTAHDMRPSSVPLSAAFADGVASRGLGVLAAGLGSTDLMYFGSGQLDIPGAMFTASHNPAAYNGIKLCRAGAAPIGADTGLADIRRDAASMVRTENPADGPTPQPIDLLPAYADHLRQLVDLSGSRPLTVVVDAANGMAGHTVPAVFDGLPIRVEPLYFELDGTFPNHEANPLVPENLADLRAAVVRSGADLGLAFDGDADRCFVVDERGEPVSPSAITALVACRELAKNPGATVIHNVITSRAVPEIVAERGGVPVRTRVGHSYIKAEMAATGAVFGGEHSAHYYFRDFWRADTGMLAALHVLAALSESAGTLSALTAEYDRYAGSGEINSTVADQAAAVETVKRAYASVDGVGFDELDGLTVTLPDGLWFNLRASNTEPLLRLNVEGPDETAMSKLRDEVLALVRD